MGRDVKMGVHSDVSKEGYVGRLDVIVGPTGRQHRTEAERARIAAESLIPGVRISDVARKHGATRWQVYDWRKRLRDGRLALPESVASAPVFAALVVEEPTQGKRPDAPIEIVIGDIIIRAVPGIDEGDLSRAIPIRSSVSLLTSTLSRLDNAAAGLPPKANREAANNITKTYRTARPRLDNAVEPGTVRISVCGRAVEHYAAIALIKRSPKITAN